MTHNFSALTYHGDLIPWGLAYSDCRSYFTQIVFWYLTFIQIEEIWKTFGIEPLLDRWTIGNSGVLSVEVGDDQPFSGSWTAQSNQDLWQPPLCITMIDCMQQDDSQLMNLLSLDDVVEILCHYHSRRQFSSPRAYYTLAHPQIPRIHLGAVYHYARRSLIHLTMEAAVEIGSFPVAISETVDDWDSTKFLQHISDSQYFRLQDVCESHIMCIFLRPHIETELHRQWLTQANSLVSFMENNESPVEFFLTTALRVYYKMAFPDCDITLQGTFMADEVPMEELYLFIRRPRKYLEDGILAIELPFDPVTGQLQYFWSIHPDAREPLDLAALDKYCPPHIETEVRVEGVWWPKEDCKMIADVMRAKGYDPTRDYAREHGIPELIFQTVTKPN
ncbi:hypothetical protein C8F01DRAFT_676818 [Mycena amicta]|nr:hypothetical protein C8F01DRAFT_676818 [Mycena amicta]